MLTPDDVLAARILYADAPQHRRQVMAALASLREGRAGQPLLTGLRASGLLNDEQLRWVEGRIEQAKRDRLMQAFAHLLVAAGSSPGDVAAHMARVPRGDVTAFGAALVAAGALKAADEQRLQVAARVVLQRELNHLLDVDRFHSGVFRVPVSRHAAAAVEARRQGAELEESREQDTGETLQLGAAETAEFLAAALAEDVEPTAANEVEQTLDVDPSAIAQLLRPPNPGSEQSEVEQTLDVDPSAIARLLAPPARGAAPPLDASGRFPEPSFSVPGWVDTRDPRLGETLGDYRLLGRVGAGAMGVVYLAQQAGDPERRVAVKVLAKEATDEAKGRFKREILANSLFDHPGALDIYGAGSTPAGEQFLAMEFCEGKDLGEWLEARSAGFEPPLALWVAACVLETLQAAHEAGVIHRDVKPGNVLLGTDRRTVKLMDFGIAVLTSMGQFDDQVFHTLGNAITGTPEYLSPEQAAGVAVVPESDVYSLGCVLYQLLAGRPPFSSESPTGYLAMHMIEDPYPLALAAPIVATRLPREFHDLLARMLSKEAEERPSAAAAADELHRILAKL